MYQLATRPQSIWQILTDSFRLYKVAFKRLAFWAVMMGLINFFSATLTSVFMINQTAENAMSAGVHLSVAVISLIVILLSLFPAAGMLFDIYETMHQRKPTLKATFARSLKSWVPLLAASILCGLMMVLLVAILLLLLKVPSPLFRFAGFVVGMGFFIYIMVNLFAWYALIVTERQGLFTALVNSFKNTRGNWWRTFLLLTIVFFVIMVINGIVGFFFTGSTMSNPQEAQSFGEMLVNVIATIIFVPWLYGVILLQIHNLELRRQLSA